MIKQFVPSRFCLDKCHICCRFSQPNSIWSPCVLNEEVSQLLKNTTLPSIILENKKIQLIPYSGLHKDKIFICPLLDLKNNKCKIYSTRPFECQLYPFLINRRDKKIFLSVDDLGCPFIKENLRSQEFKEYTEYLIALINSPPYIDKIKNNPQIIQEYKEAFDVFELKFSYEIK